MCRFTENNDKKLFILHRVRRVALIRLDTQFTAAAGDPPDTNIVIAKYQVTSENLSELNGGKPAKTESMKEIHFPNFGLKLSYLR